MLFGVVLVVCLACRSLAREDPDVGKDMYAIVSEKGYAIERHYATTTDGYILGMSVQAAPYSLDLFILRL